MVLGIDCNNNNDDCNETVIARFMKRRRRRRRERENKKATDCPKFNESRPLMAALLPAAGVKSRLRACSVSVMSCYYA